MSHWDAWLQTSGGQKLRGHPANPGLPRQQLNWYVYVCACISCMICISYSCELIFQLAAKVLFTLCFTDYAQLNCRHCVLQWMQFHWQLMFWSPILRLILRRYKMILRHILSQFRQIFLGDVKCFPDVTSCYCTIVPACLYSVCII